MTFRKIITIGLLALALDGCKPAGPPPDLVKTQREALDKAKTVEGQLQQQAEQQKKAVDEAQK